MISETHDPAHIELVPQRRLDFLVIFAAVDLGKILKFIKYVAELGELSQRERAPGARSRGNCVRNSCCAPMLESGQQLVDK